MILNVTCEPVSLRLYRVDLSYLSSNDEIQYLQLIREVVFFLNIYFIRYFLNLHFKCFPQSPPYPPPGKFLIYLKIRVGGGTEETTPLLKSPLNKLELPVDRTV